MLIHHARRTDEIATRIPHDGGPRPDLPGPHLGTEDLFGEPPEA